MEVLLTFVIAFSFSFIGTIPPGTLNLSIVQLGLEHKLNAAWRFAFASAIVEYFYGWAAVRFESLISLSAVTTQDFKLITAIVMLSLGAISLWSAQKPSERTMKFNKSGFRRGLLLGILNPMALPFWIAMTAYIKGQHWVDLSTTLELHAYLLGVSLGGFALMIVLAYLAKKVISQFQGNTLLKKIPGFTLLVLGVYAIIRYFF